MTRITAQGDPTPGLPSTGSMSLIPKEVGEVLDTVRFGENHWNWRRVKKDST
jgi:hypothetical protein